MRGVGTLLTPVRLPLQASLIGYLCLVTEQEAHYGMAASLAHA